MPWPVPSAKSVFGRCANAVEAGILRVRDNVNPAALSRAVRSARGMISQILRAIAFEVRQVHDHISYWARQYFPDTADDEAERHASIWGISRRPATKAVGFLTIEGEAGTVLPAGLEFSATSADLYTLDAETTIPGNGSLSAGVTASVAGIAGNLEAGIRISLFTPNPAISRITIDEPGLTGGAPEETDAELTTATIARIRQRGHGGAGFDYPMWLREAFPVRSVKTYPDWIGRGSVGVVVAMKADDDGRAPSPAEIENMTAYLGRPSTNEGVRPVTAHVVVVPAVITPVPLTIRIRPDTLAVRAAVTEAWIRYIRTLGDEDDAGNDTPVGATIESSRVTEAISAASGEYAHDLVSPATFTLDRTAFPIPGDITFEAPQ